MGLKCHFINKKGGDKMIGKNLFEKDEWVKEYKQLLDDTKS